MRLSHTPNFNTNPEPECCHSPIQACGSHIRQTSTLTLNLSAATHRSRHAPLTADAASRPSYFVILAAQHRICGINARPVDLDATCAQTAAAAAAEHQLSKLDTTVFVHIPQLEELASCKLDGWKDRCTTHTKLAAPACSVESESDWVIQMEGTRLT
jgi:hypothetical protein